MFLIILQVMAPHENMSMHSQEDMLDDLELAKQYKANIMNEFGIDGGAGPGGAGMGYGMNR
jgi:hypothetical protein